MIVTACIAVVVAVAAIGTAHIVSSSKPEKTIYSNATRTTLAKEQNELAKIILADLRKMVRSGRIDSERVQLAVKGYKRIISMSWKVYPSQLGQYEYNFVADKAIPFIKTLDAAVDLQGSSVSRQFLEVLTAIIEKTCEDAGRSLISGDDGANFNDLTYNITKTMGEYQKKLEALNKESLSLSPKSSKDRW